jgi:FkbH-like protein
MNALVFFDDNPVERARMRQAAPEVLTLDVPADPMRYISVLEEARPFDRLVVTQEDRQRGAIQHQERERRRESASAGSLQEFLQGLEMRVTIRLVGPEDAPRVVDLLRKTNQFNLTTRRHSAAQLDGMLRDPGVAVFSLRAADRFGDHGLVGVAIVRTEGTVATIDSFLLSCRVIGRGVEGALLVQVAEWAHDRGAGTLVGDFVPTPRNAPAADFFERSGFSQDSMSGFGGAAGSRWTMELAQMMPVWPEHIMRSDAGDSALVTAEAG